MYSIQHSRKNATRYMLEMVMLPSPKERMAWLLSYTLRRLTSILRPIPFLHIDVEPSWVRCYGRKRQAMRKRFTSSIGSSSRLIRDTILPLSDFIQSHLQFSSLETILSDIVVRPRRRQQASVLDSRNTGHQKVVTANMRVL